MKVTIIGAGNAGSTIAADLSLKGHEVTLVKTSSSMHNEHFDYIHRTHHIVLEELGVEKTAQLFCVTNKFEEAITERTELIIIFVQTNYHEEIIKKLVPFLHDGQIVMFEPGYLGTAFLLNATNKRVISVEAESSPIDCRIIRPGHCTVLFKNVRNPVGIYPKDRAKNTLKKLNLLGYNFELLGSVVEAALHNPNLIVHTIGAIMSIPRIEYSRGEYWMYKEVFTPKVWNLVNTLDAEKMSVLKAFGLQPIRYVDACKHRNFLDSTIEAEKAFFDYANNHSPKGPSSPDTRYITEDVSQGLCLLESLGKIVKIETPIATSLINMAGALLNRDFRIDGRTIERLGNESLNRILLDIKS